MGAPLRNSDMTGLRCGGFTYIGILIAVALTGVGLAATGDLWSMAAQRDKERQLLFVGDEFRRAITSYHDSTPGAAKQFPRNFEDLLRDPRYPVVRRHLRRLYADPFTGRPDWGIVPGPGGTLMGIYSLSEAAPVKRTGFSGYYQSFEKAEQYADWKFIYTGARVVTAGVPSSVAIGAGAATAQPGYGIPTSAVIGAAAPVPGSVVTAPKPKPKEEEDDPHKKTCAVLATNDGIACAAAATRYGPATGAACQATAQIRNAQCLAYGPLPPLDITP